jgi:MFS family permease
VTLRQSLRELPPTAWLLFAGTFVNRFGSFVTIFLVLYLKEQGYSTPQAGLAVSAYGLGSIGASLVGGHLADRLGRRNSIALSMFASATAMLALSQAETLPAIVTLAAFAGLAAEAYRPASGALLADLTPEGDRVTAFALYRLAINLGFAAGPAAAGLLAEQSFTALFIADAATSIVYGVVALVAFPHGPRTAQQEERRGEGFRTVARDRGFLLFLAGSVTAAFVYMQHSSTFPLAVQDAGLSLALYGTLAALNGILIVVVELPLTSVTRRFRAQPVIALGWLLTGVGFALTGFAETAVAFALTVAIWTLGEIVSSPVEGAYVADLAPERLRGRYMGAWSFAWGIGLVTGPLLGTALYAWRPDALWLTCLALGALGAGLALATPARRAHPEPVDAEVGPELVR